MKHSGKEMLTKRVGLREGYLKAAATTKCPQTSLGKKEKMKGAILPD